MKMTRFAKKDPVIIKPIDYFMKMKRFAKKDAFVVKPRLHSSINLVNHIKSRPFCLSPFGKCLLNKAYNVGQGLFISEHGVGYSNLAFFANKGQKMCDSLFII